MSDENQNEEATSTAGEAPSLDLLVNITSPSACERHVTVTVSRADIDRYFDDAFSELVPNASVPGFRVGRAPRKIVEGRFKKEVSDQVKGTLLMDCLEKIGEDKYDCTPPEEPAEAEEEGADEAAPAWKFAAE